MTQQAQPHPRPTEYIRSKCGPMLTVSLTRHAKEQMEARDLLMGDILHVLEKGNVYEPGEPASQVGLFKYKMEAPTPNSGGRTVRIVLIPYPSPVIKIVTVMWVDGDRTGS